MNLTICVVAANLIQGLIVLPLMLKYKGIPPIEVFKKVSSVLWMGFLTKSSTAILPMTIKYCTDRLKLSEKVSNFSLPICTSINMNACAGFILITVLFSLQSYGYSFTTYDYLSVLLFAIVAAIGNAGVPMGCFFMTTSFLVASDVPLTMMSIILPVYVFLDMLETAINIWSDICVTAIVDKKHKETVLVEQIVET